jgi:sugar phosphate isomerase/epimerase
MTFPSGRLCNLALVMILTLTASRARAEAPPEKPLFARDNLVAWCVVPFDAKKRGPAERAQMLKRLGITRLAYDWRNEHVPTFEQEILELRKHGIEFFAFWGQHEEMFRLFEKHRLAPQVWQTAPSPDGKTQEERIESSVKSLMPLVERTGKLGCKLGLYNHGGWGGEPANLVAVCRRLRERAGAEHVGIVYNLHHGHDHLTGFAESLGQMKPYLLCLNLNGMNDRAMPKILPLGQGKHDKRLFEVIRASGYSGPIGVLDHRPELDAEESLRLNLEGLKHLLHEVGDAALKTYR